MAELSGREASCYYYVYNFVQSAQEFFLSTLYYMKPDQHEAF